MTLQRGPRCFATACSLSSDGVLIADQRGPYCSVIEFLSSPKKVSNVKTKALSLYF